MKYHILGVLVPRGTVGKKFAMHEVKIITNTKYMRYLLTFAICLKFPITMMQQKAREKMADAVPPMWRKPAVMTINVKTYMPLKIHRVTRVCDPPQNKTATIMINENSPTTTATAIGDAPVAPKNVTSSAPVAKPAPTIALIIKSTSSAILPHIQLY